MSKTLAISGASGFIGSYLVSFFRQLNYTVHEIHRNDFESFDNLHSKIIDSQVVINLAGKSVFSRWTPKNKASILESRISTTKKIVNIIDKTDKPIHLLNASAIGIYEPFEVHDEDSTQFSDNFLFDVVSHWESEANKLNNSRLTLMRFGVVLGHHGGAFKTINLLNKLRMGNYFGKGDQPFPYIHIHDLAQAVLSLIENPTYGIINFSSPEHITYYDFMKEVSKHYQPYLLFSVPEFSVKLLLGEASQFILKTPFVEPKKLINSGFNFTFPTIKDCLNELI